MTESGYTHVGVNFSYTWRVVNFRDCRKKNGDPPLTSPALSAIVGNDKLTWCLELYPKGIFKKAKDHISLYLKLVSCNRTKIRATYKFSILNVRGVKAFESEIKNDLFELNSDADTFGIHSFVTRNFILHDENGLLLNNTLTVLCEIGVCVNEITASGKFEEHKHEFQLSDDMRSLFECMKLSDITLSVNEEEFEAHKIILAARSPVFAAMFENEMAEKIQNRITITDVQPKVIKEMLTFIYTDESPNLDDMVYDLLEVAEKYDIKKLKMMCEKDLSSKITPGNAVHLLILADKYNANWLKSEAINFIAARSHTADVMETQSWKNDMMKYPEFMSEIISKLSSRNE